MQVREVPVPLVEVESVADEELVGDGEPDVRDREVLDEPSVRPVEQRRDAQRSGRAQAERPPEVVQRQAGVDDVLDDEHVPAGDLAFEVLEQPDPAAARAVRRELEEVELVRDRDRARKIGQEDEARLERRDEQRVTSVEVARDLLAQLANACRELVPREVDLRDLSAGAYEARSSRYRSASRAMSRL